MTPQNLSKQIAEFVAERAEAIVTRFLPGFVIPRFFCGYWRPSCAEEANLIYLLAHLHRLEVGKVGGVPIEQAIATLLRGIDGPRTETFYSFYAADSLLAFGPFETNPLLADFSAAERENVKAAIDTTHIYDPETKWIRGFPNNYWAVLARCEFARQRLGVLGDDSILKNSIEQLQKLLFLNPLGFFDDGKDGRGRYDIYSADVHLFCEPLWGLFDREKIEWNLGQHTRLLEKIVMENGASFVFGRSIGGLSICLTMEFLAMSLAEGLAADPDRSLKLIGHAFASFTSWFEDDLMNAHRHGDTDGYRGIHRVLQMTLDCLAKLCYVAEKLHAVPAPAPSPALLLPDVDKLIRFDEGHAGVWMFRNAHLAFQLPLVEGYNADYAPWCRSPGLLENPVDSPMFCGVPRIARGGEEFTVMGLPAEVKKMPAGITIVYENFLCVSGDRKAAPFRGRRVATYRVDGDMLFIEEELTFETVPDAVSYFIPETAHPLDVECACASSFHHDTMAIEGMAEWRSPWSELKTLHQAHFVPAREIRFTCAIRPKLRVCVTPGRDHDYVRALFDKLSSRSIVEMAPLPNSARVPDVPRLTREMDILHVGWPEHLLANPGLEEAEFDQVFEFVEALGESGARIVWTMHNRRPHWWSPERGKRLYCAWARVADVVIHHSEWGMKLARQELPYKAEARHVVLPHGHYGEQMRVTRSRTELEAALGLPPCGTRFGLLGRPQAEKRVEMILRAFATGARDDQQLVITAYDDKTPRPADPRIIFIPRKQWMSREDIADSTHVCDALVSAHVGDSYFTSGLSADAIGTGIPMLVPHWGFFHETFGDAAFYHDNTEESLAALFRSVSPAEIESKRALLLALQPGSEWSLIAEKTLALYRSLGRKRV